jgi:two-component system OmpR family sensor kinase
VSLRTRLVLLFTLAALIVGVAGGLVFARRLQLGLESDLDGVMRQRADAVAADNVDLSQPARLDLREAEGPVQFIDPSGKVLASARGASPVEPLLDAGQRARALKGVLIVDGVQPAHGHYRNVRILGRPAAGGNLVVVTIGRATVDDAVTRTTVQLAVIGLPATVLVALGLWMVTGAALRPVERMRAQAAAANPSQPTVLSVPPGKDELSRLASTLNDLLAAQQAALRAEQSFLADAGHELRTPLAILAGELEFADRPTRTEAELRETITVAREETTRLVRLAEQLLVLARVDGTGLARTEVELRALARQAAIAWSATARAHDVEIDLAPGEEITAWLDPDRIRQVLDNLLANGLRAAPAGTSVEISVTSGTGPDGPVVQFAVRDRGPGFPGGFLPQAFERFSRADPARARGGPATPGASSDSSGTGLGLAVVRRIAEAHGGTAIALNCPDDGAIVQVVLPHAVVPATAGSPRGESVIAGSFKGA